MFLLDTNVISELRKAGDGKADPNVLAWLSGADASALYISVITLFEIELGILRVDRRDTAQGRMLRSWLNERVLPEFVNRTLPVDATVALRCAPIHVPDPRPERDAFLAATALVHGLTIVTRNVTDFKKTGAAVLNPWNPA
ncbi:type II toxin-antitoxin system VapC family toxin [Terriglobus sp.]|uniref:type II toxin-antitoxin system VapC family toxin n=1 Tax=Terriglobus sp. TaxID=1889013 RepID=UPI003AFF85EE